MWRIKKRDESVQGFSEERGRWGMQENEVKSCCQAETDKQQEDKRHGPLTDHF